MFGNKTGGVGVRDTFSHKQLTAYIESILRDCSRGNKTQDSSYNWLSDRSKQVTALGHLKDLDNLAKKIAPERCASIAVKLDKMIEDNFQLQPEMIINFCRHLLEEEHRCELIALSVERKRSAGKAKTNRVAPELFPPGRQATVSFIFQEFEVAKA